METVSQKSLATNASVLDVPLMLPSDEGDL